MPKQLQPRHQEVYISSHAWDERWPERVGIKLSHKKLVRKLKGRLTALAQSDGIHLDHTGACWVEVYPWLWATVRLTERGWLVMTFTVWDSMLPEREQTG